MHSLPNFSSLFLFFSLSCSISLSFFFSFFLSLCVFRSKRVPLNVLLQLMSLIFLSFSYLLSLLFFQKVLHQLVPKISLSLCQEGLFLVLESLVSIRNQFKDLSLQTVVMATTCFNFLEGWGRRRWWWWGSCCTGETYKHPPLSVRVFRVCNTPYPSLSLSLWSSKFPSRCLLG